MSPSRQRKLRESKTAALLGTSPYQPPHVLRGGVAAVATERATAATDDLSQHSAAAAAAQQRTAATSSAQCSNNVAAAALSQSCAATAAATPMGSAAASTAQDSHIAAAAASPPTLDDVAALKHAAAVAAKRATDAVAAQQAAADAVAAQQAAADAAEAAMVDTNTPNTDSTDEQGAATRKSRVLVGEDGSMEVDDDDVACERVTATISQMVEIKLYAGSYATPAFVTSWSRNVADGVRTWLEEQTGSGSYTGCTVLDATSALVRVPAAKASALLKCSGMRGVIAAPRQRDSERAVVWLPAAPTSGAGGALYLKQVLADAQKHDGFVVANWRGLGLTLPKDRAAAVCEAVKGVLAAEDHPLFSVDIGRNDDADNLVLQLGGRFVTARGEGHGTRRVWFRAPRAHAKFILCVGDAELVVWPEKRIPPRRGWSAEVVTKPAPATGRASQPAGHSGVPGSRLVEEIKDKKKKKGKTKLNPAPTKQQHQQQQQQQKQLQQQQQQQQRQQEQQKRQQQKQLQQQQQEQQRQQQQQKQQQQKQLQQQQQQQQQQQAQHQQQKTQQLQQHQELKSLLSDAQKRQKTEQEQAAAERRELWKQLNKQQKEMSELVKLLKAHTAARDAATPTSTADEVAVERTKTVAAEAKAQATTAELAVVKAENQRLAQEAVNTQARVDQASEDAKAVAEKADGLVANADARAQHAADLAARTAAEALQAQTEAEEELEKLKAAAQVKVATVMAAQTVAVDGARAQEKATSAAANAAAAVGNAEIARLQAEKAEAEVAAREAQDEAKAAEGARAAGEAAATAAAAAGNAALAHLQTEKATAEMQARRAEAELSRVREQAEADATAGAAAVDEAEERARAWAAGEAAATAAAAAGNAALARLQAEKAKAEEQARRAEAELARVRDQAEAGAKVGAAAVADLAQVRGQAAAVAKEDAAVTQQQAAQEAESPQPQHLTAEAYTALEEAALAVRDETTKAEETARGNAMEAWFIAEIELQQARLQGSTSPARRQTEPKESKPGGPGRGVNLRKEKEKRAEAGDKCRDNRRQAKVEERRAAVKSCAQRAAGENDLDSTDDEKDVPME